MKLVDKIKVVVTSLFKSIYYMLQAVLSYQNLERCDSNFVVSLTSYGRRKNFVFLTVESILSQKLKPRRIILWLHHSDQPKGIYAWLLNRQVKRGLDLRYTDIDARSYKKLSFILSERNCESFVVTADDDVFYPREWLLGFHQCVNEDPNMIYCYRGRVIECDDEGEITGYNQWRLANKADCQGRNLIPTGVSGICYPLSALDSRISDFESINKLCPFADDIWYKLLTLSNGYQAMLVGNESVHFTPIITAYEKGLEKINVLNDKNSEQFVSAAEYFNIHRDSFR